MYRKKLSFMLTLCLLPFLYHMKETYTTICMRLFVLDLVDAKNTGSKYSQQMLVRIVVKACYDIIRTESFGHACSCGNNGHFQNSEFSPNAAVRFIW